jgi:hypothetical protein
VARPNERVDGYDSQFEKDLHDGVLKGWEEHEEKLPYVIDHNYHPDFGKQFGDKKIIIEAKGRFWDSAEYSKYLWIRKCLPKDYELIFVFMNPEKAMPNAKKRKDGTKRTMAEWAESKNFRWYTMETFPEELK